MRLFRRGGCGWRSGGRMKGMSWFWILVGLRVRIFEARMVNAVR